MIIIAGTFGNSLPVISQCMRIIGFESINKKIGLNVSNIHRLFFNDLNISPYSSKSFPPRWIETDGAKKASERIIRLIESKKENINNIFVADPLLCRLMPLWVNTLKKNNLPFKTIIALNKPSDIVVSNHNRIFDDIRHALLVWFVYMKEAFVYNNWDLIVDFDKFCEDPISTFNIIKKNLNCKFVRNPLYVSEDIIESAIKKSKKNDIKNLNNNIEILNASTKLYGKIIKGIDSKLDLKEINDIYNDNMEGIKNRISNNTLLIDQSKKEKEVPLFVKIEIESYQNGRSNLEIFELCENNWQNIVMPINRIKCSHDLNVKIRPINSCGTVLLSEFTLLSYCKGEKLWNANNSSEYDEFELFGSGIRLPDKNRMVLLITGNDFEINISIDKKHIEKHINLSFWIKVSTKQEILYKNGILPLSLFSKKRKNGNEQFNVRLPNGLKFPDDEDEIVDYLLQNNTELNNSDKIKIYFAFGRYYKDKSNILRAMHFFAQARKIVGDNPYYLLKLASCYEDIGNDSAALELYIISFLKRAFVNQKQSERLLKRYTELKNKENKSIEHGHQVLINYIKNNIGYYKSKIKRKLVLLEIGTTREDVPSQGSTIKLAKFCNEMNIHFITVDMDSRNTKQAHHDLKKINRNYEAINNKGEVFLEEFNGDLDFVFIDAYDFDHGQHSEERQKRYVQNLGQRISDEGCHQMHLDCAIEINKKLSPNGIVCFDDTWFKNGGWQAKGTLAVPYLLNHKFQIILSSNNSVLLVKSENILTGDNKIIKNQKKIFRQIAIETSSYCNRKCDYCPNKYYERKNKILNKDIIYNILKQLNELSYTGKIFFHLFNEPLLDKRIYEIIEFARKMNPKCRIVMSSNGDYLNTENMDKLIDSGIDNLLVTQYDGVISENILKVKESLNESKKKYLTVRIKNEFKNNRGGYVKLPIRENAENSPCSRPNRMLVINHEGKALICCNDYFGKEIIGDIQKEKLVDIWNNKKIEYFRDNLQKGNRKISKLCYQCSEVVDEN